ncbi:MAG: glycosyl hydrolase [bacterium]
MKIIRIGLIILFSIVSISGFGQESLSSRFAGIPAEYSPVPIWWWSGDRIEKDQIRYQLERMAEGGIHNAMILNLAPSGPLYGSYADDPPFLSEEWWDLFGYALSVGKEVGVKLWFYDQLGFSGAGLQARVVRDHPEFRGVELQRVERQVTGPAEITLQTPPGGTALTAFIAEVDESGIEYPQWIWDTKALTAEVKRYFRRTFQLDEVPAKAELHITCNDGYIVYVNGTRVGDDLHEMGSDISNAERFEVGGHLRAGKNVIAVMGQNLGGPAFVLLDLILGDPSEKSPGENQETSRIPRIVSDREFRVNDKAPTGWTRPEFDDSDWDLAGPVPGSIIGQWGSIAGIEIGSGRQIRNVRNLTGDIANGSLHISIPSGLHSAQLYYTSAGGFDYQNPEAGAALIDVVHGEMERRFGHELGKSIAGSFQDEFPELPRYSRRFAEEFRKRKGYDLLEYLPVLYDEVIGQIGSPDDPTPIQIRCDANDTAAALCEEAFFIPLHEWHEKHGLLCGYDQTNRNADPIRGDRYYIDYFKTMRHYSVPGSDMDGDSKPHQSIADLYKRPRVWIEAFHSSGWGQTLEEINTLLNPWLVNGATLYDPHAIYYSIHGSYWEWAPPDTGWRQPYFQHYKAFADYISRLTYVLSQGSHAVEVGLLHPANTVHGFSGYGTGSSAAHQAHSLYWQIQNVFRDNCVDYIIVDEDSIHRGTVTDGTLTISDVALRVILLPGTSVLYGETLSKLTQYAEHGGTLVIAGDPPEYPADRALPAGEFKKMCNTLKKNAVRIKEPEQALDEVLNVVPRDMLQVLPVLRRKIENRSFYFVLSDNETKQNGGERRGINRRKLWETAAGQGERMSFALNTDGIPERWDALSGNVLPINSYRRYGGYTRVDVELADTPAPLIAIRPAKSNEPLAIESDLEILDWEPGDNDDSMFIHGLQRIDPSGKTSTQHTVRVEFSDSAYEGVVELEDPLKIDIPDPLTCRLKPTCDNKYGGFAWPPSEGPIPVEVRSARFHSEGKGTDINAWKSPDFDDSGWETVIASFGPRAEWTGPLPLANGERFETLTAPPKKAGPFQPAVYSLRLGINEDPVFWNALGGKGRIPEDFIDLGYAEPDKVYLVRAIVSVDADNDLDAVLRVGGTSMRRVFLNGEEVKFQAAGEARKARAPVQLRPGPNRLEVLLVRKTAGSVRLFYQFLPPHGIADVPEWIWSPQPSPTGKMRLTRTLDIPGEIASGEMIVALGDLHQIRINGELVADQGNFDPYFTSRAERYDIKKSLQSGENRIEIEARDTGESTGLLLDGLVVLKDGREIPFVSDDSFLATTAGGDQAQAQPARVLSGPARDYMGDPALMLLRPRPHPLPLGGWLDDQSPLPEPFDRLTYQTSGDKPSPGWYRFLIPPGASSISIETPGQAELYVNGKAVPLEKKENSHSAKLDDTMNPRRIAALRIASIAGFEDGAALLEPITFEVGQGRIPYGSWDHLGLPHYCGGLVYEANVNLPDNRATHFVLDLGRVRGTTEVVVNGEPCGVRVWHPYRFDITKAVRAGTNRVEMHIYNTLGPHFDIGHPSEHVYENHTVSGVFGPVAVYGLKQIDLRLQKKGL